MGKLTGLCVSLLSMLYPVLWWLFHERAWQISPLALAMAALWALRAVFSPSPRHTFSLFFCAFFLLVAVARIPALMLYYPLLVNAVMLLLFAGSLFIGPPLVERLARLQHPHLSPQGVSYTRRVTFLWCVFFLVNGALIGGLIFLGNMRWWAIYSGAVSYVLMGALFLLEWGYRKWILKLPA